MKNPMESTIISAISETAGIPAGNISPDHSFQDLEGMNSILAVRLMSRLQQKLGVEANLNDLNPGMTISELANYFENKRK
ncbi:acyl carrier protein [Chitinophaga qingshengii]|uniref:Acyl carrier protein n=1 Tax=Chitinophaga qingshengii TaxID=1569794 RepID=A0ABR7TIS5_9BACT|nr:acyl carrier protein [Chitinophaga qingshengii]MBC9929382.1 acyl carrier protein [Chitinophaga qingshengii]